MCVCEVKIKFANQIRVNQIRVNQSRVNQIRAANQNKRSKANYFFLMKKLIYFNPDEPLEDNIKLVTTSA